MISRYMIDCACKRPDWPFVPLSVACGSPLTVGVTGIKSKCGVTVTGCQVRITNADGTALTKTCVKCAGGWSATFPASHFANYGTVKNGVVVFAVGKDENETSQTWIERVGDLKVLQISTSQTSGSNLPKDTYHKSEVVDGVQHYKKEVLTYSTKQAAWGVEFTGDYIFSGGDFVPYTSEE